MEEHKQHDEMMKDIGPSTTTAAMLQSAHASSVLHIPHGGYLPTKKHFDCDWDILLSRDTDSLH